MQTFNRIAYAALVLATLVVAAPARAQDNSPEARAAAHELIGLINLDALFDTIVEAMVPQLADALANSTVGGRATAERALREIVVPALRDDKPIFVEAMVDIYVQNFMRAEIDDISAFYRTPTGQKSLRTLPQVTQQSIAAGGAWGGRAAERAIARNLEELRHRGIKL